MPSPGMSMTIGSQRDRCGLRLNPPEKMPLATLGDIQDPEEALKKLGLVVSYAGARPPSGTAPDNQTK